MKNKLSAPKQGTLFEEDYLIRSVGSIAYSADVALTELVANAWDAGASKVKISIPDQYDQYIIIEDDGTGMTSEQFKIRWMTLGYNRVKHQGGKAEFPPERNNWNRMAFGKNGLGRHGLLCFADKYEVQTFRDGICSHFVISTSCGNQPFELINESTAPQGGHGTILKALVKRNLVSPDSIRDVLSARFLHDPNFIVSVNNESVPLTNHPGLMDQSYFDITEKVRLEIIFIDSTKTARTIKHQGIAFWVGHRLVGEPSWNIGSRVIIDGRTRFAKKYTIVVKTEDLHFEVFPDWSAFKESPLMEKVYDVVEEHVKNMIQKVAKERIQETKESVIREHIDGIRQLQPLARHEVQKFVDELTEVQPIINPDTLSIAVKAMINLEKSQSGTCLLEKLASLSEEDIDGLDRLLSEWTIHDALNVLDEIDRRIATLEAIKRLSGDKKINELQTLHPLVTQARWLFGPEYESAEYSSNISLSNAISKVFGERKEKSDFLNSRKRPDLIILKDASLSAVCLESFDDQSQLKVMRKIILIELKRGDSTIGRNEMTQAEYYVQDILTCGLIEGQPDIHAFVVGHKIENKVVTIKKIGESENGRIQATTYGQLVRTGEARLFKLRERLQERYDDKNASDLIFKVLSEPTQKNLFPENTENGGKELGTGT